MGIYRTEYDVPKGNLKNSMSASLIQTKDMIIDFEKVKKIYKLSKHLKFSDIQALVRAAEPRSFAIREYIQEEGSLNRTVYFIQKGLIRTFLINDLGNETTTWLRYENQIFVNLDVLLFEQPSRFYVQALEPTTTLTINFDLLQEIISQNPQLEPYRRSLLRDVLRSTVKHTESFMLYSPERTLSQLYKTASQYRESRT
jgi:CRP-like cAMP-binding protein